MWRECLVKRVLWGVICEECLMGIIVWRCWQESWVRERVEVVMMGEVALEGEWVWKGRDGGRGGCGRKSVGGAQTAVT